MRINQFEPAVKCEAIGRLTAIYARIVRDLASATPLMSLSPASVAC